MVPADSFAVDDNGATFLVAPVKVLAANVKCWGGGDVNTFADAHVKADFLGDLGGT